MRKLLFFCFLFCSINGFAQYNQEKLLVNLKTLASDEMGGRQFGTKESAKAQAYIINEFEQLDIKPAIGDSYLQPFTHKGKIGNNIVAIIPGNSDKTIVVTGHFDHLGIKGEQIYNGADDNASGTAALFAIGEYFKANPLNHTLVLAAVDAEEIGSIGAQHLLDNFPKPQEDIVLNVNLDMIAHNDSNELYACGTYFYPQLKAPLTNLKSTIDLKFGHDSPEFKGSDNWTFASDHRVFHKKEIPFVYFGVEDHADYHQASDTYETINEAFYIKAVDLVIEAIEGLDKL